MGYGVTGSVNSFEAGRPKIDRNETNSRTADLSLEDMFAIRQRRRIVCVCWVYALSVLKFAPEVVELRCHCDGQSKKQQSECVDGQLKDDMIMSCAT